MEDLINNMKEMFINSGKDDGNKYLFFSPKYNPVVKTSDWYLPLEANPKDNDPYHPPGGNYFLSTYRRFGTEDTTMETTTQAMLRQICSEHLDHRVHKPLVSTATHQLFMEEEPMACKGELCEEMDFTTTYDYEYRHPFPYRKRYSSKIKETPQRRFPLPSNYGSSKICETKFLDDELYNLKPAAASRLVPPYETHESLVSSG